MIIIVDVQNDFIEGGKLAVNGGTQVSHNIQDWISENRLDGEMVLLTQDWHPTNHCSFKENGGEWPEHCVQNTAGAAFEETLVKFLGNNNIEFTIQKKGWNPEKDMYSFLDDVDLMSEYTDTFNEAERIVVTGIVGTVCVKNTVQSLIDMGYSDKIVVPIECVAHFDEDARLELFNWLNENYITIL